jgi:hypothetical protein
VVIHKIAKATGLGIKDVPDKGQINQTGRIKIPLDYLVVTYLELFALSLLVFTDALIANLVTAGEFLRRNKIIGGPLRAIRAEVPSVGA